MGTSESEPSRGMGTPAMTVENDSTARLSTGNALQYIMLRKAAENK